MAMTQVAKLTITIIKHELTIQLIDSTRNVEIFLEEAWLVKQLFLQILQSDT